MVAKTILAGAAALLLAGGGAALACTGTTNPAIKDKFNPPDPSWGQLTAPISASPQGLVITPVAGQNFGIYNSNFTLDGSDFCLQVLFPSTMPSPANDSTVGDVGAIFWWKDWSDYYTATIAPDGTAAIYRLISGNWNSVYGPTASTAIKTAPGSNNEIEVQVTGNSGTFTVNGTKVTTFSGQAPANGGPPGIYCESGDTTATTWVFPLFQIY